MSNITYGQIGLTSELNNCIRDIGNIRADMVNVRSEIGSVRSEIGSVRAGIENTNRLLEERRSIEIQKEAINTLVAIIRKAKNSYDKATEKLDREEFEEDMTQIEEVEKLKKVRAEYIESQKKEIIKRAEAKGYRVMEVKKDNRIQLTLVREVR